MWTTMTKEETRRSNLACYAFAAVCMLGLILLSLVA